MNKPILTKSERYGVIGAMLFALLTVLVLIFTFMPQKKIKVEERGIMVSFGNSVDGTGAKNKISDPPAEIPATPTPRLEKVIEEKLMTQQAEDAPRVKNTPMPQKNSPPKKEEKDEKKKVNDSENKKKTIASIVDNLVGGALNERGKGSGDTRNETTKGTLTGKGTSNGHNWSLSGRGLVGNVASPIYNSNVEGKVTVAIRVDTKGEVVGVSVGSPTNISDANTRKAAMDAARKTKFTPSGGISVGSITYNFNLN